MLIEPADSQSRQLLSDRFVWKAGKPEPFEQLRKYLKCHWERLENENHCDFIDRLHENWKKLELGARHELEKFRGRRSHRSIDDDGEVTHVDFSWKGRNVRCETFLKVDLNDSKDVFEASKIFDNFNTKMAGYDDAISEEREIRAKYVQHVVALKATKTKLKTSNDIKKLIEGAYDEMDSRNQDQWNSWIAKGERVLRGEKVDDFPKSPGDYVKHYAAVAKIGGAGEAEARSGPKTRKWITTAICLPLTQRTTYFADHLSTVTQRQSI